MLRYLAITQLDGLLAAVSFALALHLRAGLDYQNRSLQEIAFASVAFAVFAVSIFHINGLYRRVWRYASLRDIVVVIRAVTIAVVVFWLSALASGQLDWAPRSMPAIQWCVLVILLCGARTARRLARERDFGGKLLRRGFLGPEAAAPTPPPAPRRLALLLGDGDEVDMQLRRLERDAQAGLEPVGILDSRGEHLGLSIRGVPVLGTAEALEQAVKRLQARHRRPECLVVVGPSDAMGGAAWAQLVAHAESLRLDIERLPKPAKPDADNGLDLRRGDMAALLGRPQANLDFSKVAEAIEGRRVLITGAGGTIGRELARQIAAVGPESLLLVDHGEFNLYSVDMEVRESHPGVRCAPLLCSVRERKRVMQLFAEHAPELVFHAAALKHVPLVEINPCAGVLTNVLGTRNVADAVRRYGVRAMVQVSTDKAVNPVGVMGATKRLAELYCQAMDLETAGRSGAPRFMTVRFGNVLGSSGSLIPLFQSQLSRGGPLTVTHPDITRYFMTVHEAVQLVLRGSVEALTGERSRGRVLVLDMGEPVKVIDIARRMIRLAGLRPELDVPIQIIGLRPGEKLFEELFDATERPLTSNLPGIFEAEPNPVPLDLLNRAFDQLAAASTSGDPDAIANTIKAILPGYGSSGEPERLQPIATPSPLRAVAPALQAS